MSQSNRSSLVLPALILSTVTAYLAFGLIANAALTEPAAKAISLGGTIGH